MPTEGQQGPIQQVLISVGVWILSDNLTFRESLRATKEKTNDN